MRRQRKAIERLERRVADADRGLFVKTARGVLDVAAVLGEFENLRSVLTVAARSIEGGGDDSTELSDVERLVEGFRSEAERLFDRKRMDAPISETTVGGRGLSDFSQALKSRKAATIWGGGVESEIAMALYFGLGEGYKTLRRVGRLMHRAAEFDFDKRV
jgi:hypothetical protein